MALSVEAAADQLQQFYRIPKALWVIREPDVYDAL
jgi:hypothetical protein